MSAQSPVRIEGLMLHRVHNEFLEVPGLRLTCSQARQRWSLTEQTCREIFDFLVDASFLCCTEHGAYSRMNDGVTAQPQLPMTAAATEDICVAGRARVPVLITSNHPGERAEYARRIHNRSRGRRSPLVRFLAGPMSAPASSSVCGCHGARLRQAFEQAGGGTLFVDHIERLTKAGQTELLSLLEEHRLTTHTNGATIPRTPRIIAGASRHLAADCATGAFSEELFYRVNAIHINLIKS